MTSNYGPHGAVKKHMHNQGILGNIRSWTGQNKLCCIRIRILSVPIAPEKLLEAFRKPKRLLQVRARHRANVPREQEVEEL